MEQETLIIIIVLIAAVLIAGIVVVWAIWAITSLHWWHRPFTCHSSDNHHHWENEDDLSSDETDKSTLSYCV